MSSFFSSIRSYFKEKYDGRYFSVLLLELAKNEPDSFSSIIDHIAKNCSHPLWRNISLEIRDGVLSAKREHRFKGKTKLRNADLAFSRGRKAVLLMEVKEFDNRNPENPEQLSDYLGQASRGLGFIYVYRFLPIEEDYNKLSRAQKQGRPVASLSYNNIYKVLKSSADQGRPIAKLICSYLESIGVETYHDIDLNRSDAKAAKFLLLQMLGFSQYSGMQRIQSDAAVRSGPDLLQKMLSNIAYIGEWIRVQNIKIIPRHFTRRFWIAPQFDHETLRKDLLKSDSTIDELPKWGMASYVEAGQVLFEAIGAVRTRKKRGEDRRLNVNIGFALELKKGHGSIRSYAYCSIGTFGYPSKQKLSTDQTRCDSDYLRSFPDEDAALRIFNKLLKKSLTKAIRQAHGPVVRAIGQLEVPRIEPVRRAPEV